MFSTSRFLLGFAIVFSSAAVAQASAEQPAAQTYTALKPGMWEIRTATRMQGMPSELPPVPYNTTQCMTQAQLDNQQNLAKVSGAQGDCDIRDANVTPERTIWSMTCNKNGMDIDAKGMITPISTEAYTGKVEFIMKSGNFPAMHGVVNVQGLWQGECAGNTSASGMEPTFRGSATTTE